MGKSQSRISGKRRVTTTFAPLFRYRRASFEALEPRLVLSAAGANTPGLDVGVTYPIALTGPPVALQPPGTPTSDDSGAPPGDIWIGAEAPLTSPPAAKPPYVPPQVWTPGTIPNNAFTTSILAEVPPATWNGFPAPVLTDPWAQTGAINFAYSNAVVGKPTVLPIKPPESDGLYAISADGPQNGAISVDSNGQFIYTATQAGSDQFEVYVGDGPLGGSYDYRVDIADYLPWAVPSPTLERTVVTHAGQPAGMPPFGFGIDGVYRLLTGVNDPGVLGNGLAANTMSIVSAPQHATLAFVPSIGSFFYQSFSDFAGSDDFTIQVHLLMPDSTWDHFDYYDGTIHYVLTPAPAAVDASSPPGSTASLTADDSLGVLAAKSEMPTTTITATPPVISTAAMQMGAGSGTAESVPSGGDGAVAALDLALASASPADDSAKDASDFSLALVGLADPL
jgi:hypothetical protein